jgi:MFS transporter, OFA family, oxalate/formate antiporter
VSAETEPWKQVRDMNRIFYGWWIVLAGFMISLYVGSVVFFGLTAFVEPIIHEFGWSYTQVSFATSLRGLEMGLFAPFVGFLVDRFGSRKLVFLGSIVIGLGLILLSRTQSLFMFYSAYVLIAFGAGGCTSVVLMVAIGNWFDRNIGKALGLMASGFGASGLVVPIIVWMIDLYGWRTTLVVLGLGMWLLGLPLSAVVRNSPEPYGFAPDGDVFEGSAVSSGTDGSNLVTPDLMALIKSRPFIYLNIVEAIRMMAVTAAVLHVMPYLGSIGMTRTTAGYFAALIPLCSIIGRFGFGWLGDIFPKRYVLAATFGFMAAGMLAFCNVQITWIMVVFLLLFPPGFGGVMVLRGALLREYYGRGALGKMLGIIMGSAAMGGVVGPTLAGWAYDTTGSYRQIWLVFFGFLVMAFFLSLRFRPVKTQVFQSA